VPSNVVSDSALAASKPSCVPETYIEAANIVVHDCVRHLRSPQGGD
jgi:hypothetical protein